MQIREAYWLNSRADERLASPVGPAGMPAGSDNTAVLIESLSMARRLTSGDHGKFSFGVSHPTLRLRAAFPMDGGNMWWCMSTRSRITFYGCNQPDFLSDADTVYLPLLCRKPCRLTGVQNRQIFRDSGVLILEPSASVHSLSVSLDSGRG